MLLQRSISQEPNIEGENGSEIPLAVNDSLNEQAPQDSESEFEGENEIPVAVQDSLHEQAPQDPDVTEAVESYDTEPDFDSDGVLNCESLNIDLQMLSINDPGNNVEDLRLSEWQEILCKFSADILRREQIVTSKEKTITLNESRSMLLECTICMESNCNIITFPCMHLVMCKACFDSHTEDTNVLHSCPICRALIQSSSHVYLV